LILVDTSVWVDHLRRGDATLAALLDGGRVLTHPFVVGELALGNLQHRARVVHDLRRLPKAAVATDPEVLTFIEEEELFGLGIGYVDAHLLAAARLSPGASLWTRDKRLRAAGERLSVSVDPAG
jgi:predicted nucleic acid-binding protein